MRRVQAEITIDARPEQVWSVLTDFAAYPEWNPFMPRISGPLQVGGKLTVRLQPPGGRGMTFRPTVQAVEPGRRFSWLGRLLVPGVFDGIHEFVLTPVGGGRTLMLQRETFSGILVTLFGRTLEQSSTGFDDLNAALKARVELQTVSA